MFASSLTTQCGGAMEPLITYLVPNYIAEALTIRYTGGGGVYRIENNNRALKFFEKNN